MLTISLLISLSLKTANAASPSCIQSEWQSTPLQALRDSGVAEPELARGIKNFCDEFSGNAGSYQKTLLLKTNVATYAGWLNYPAPVIPTTAKNQNLTLEKPLSEAIRKIALIPNALERIRETFEAVAIKQASFDFASWNPSAPNRKNWPVLSYLSEKNVKHSPYNGVQSASRKYAALLYWTLFQVRNGPNKKPQFDIALVAGWLPNDEGSSDGHSWVRVTIEEPKKTALTFDLDSLRDQSFAPLWPRLSGIDAVKRERLIQLCKEASACEIGKLTKALSSP